MAACPMAVLSNWTAKELKVALNLDQRCQKTLIMVTDKLMGTFSAFNILILLFHFI